MKFCKCRAPIPHSIVVDNKRRNLKNRTKCLECLPFKISIYSKKSDDEKRLSKAQKSNKWYYKQTKLLGKDPIGIRRDKYKNAMVSIIGGKCQICSYSKCLRNLVFHHLNNKEFGVSSREFQFSLNRILPEILKCALVCHNCHGEIHAGLINSAVVIQSNQILKEALSILVKNKYDWSDVLELARPDLNREPSSYELPALHCATSQ